MKRISEREAVLERENAALRALLRDIRDTHRPHFKGCICVGCEAFAKLEAQCKVTTPG